MLGADGLNYLETEFVSLGAVKQLKSSDFFQFGNPKCGSFFHLSTCSFSPKKKLISNFGALPVDNCKKTGFQCSPVLDT